MCGGFPSHRGGLEIHMEAGPGNAPDLISIQP
jgi:hypothetical protein